MAERYKTTLVHNFRDDPRSAGRPKGSRGRIVKAVKDAIEGALNELGELEPVYKTIGKGKNKTKVLTGYRATGIDGAKGYLRWLGVNEPRSFANLVGKIIPLQVQAKLQAQINHQHNHTVTITERFKDEDIEHMTADQLSAAYAEAISMTQPLPQLPSPSMIEVQEAAVAAVAEDEASQDDEAEEDRHQHAA